MQFLRSAKWRDFIIMIVVLFTFWLPVTEMDLFEWFYDYSRAHEDWDLDEVVLLILFMPVPLAWYAIRRVREGEVQAKRLLEAERQLSHARKLDSMGTLAAGMAHQVNNQLQPVIGLSELIVSQADEADPKRRQMEMIRDAAMRARTSLDTVLRISRRDDDEQRVPNIDSDMADLVDILSLSCPSDVTFAVDIAQGLPAPQINWDDLESIVMNLFSNALGAMDGQQGTLGLTVAAGANPQSGKSGKSGKSGLALALSDTGKGIPADVMDRIFEPYFTSKPVGEGTGLGLWQVQEMLRAAGGNIAVQSKPGQGARFEIWLPVIS